MSSFSQISQNSSILEKSAGFVIEDNILEEQEQFKAKSWAEASDTKYNKLVWISNLFFLRVRVNKRLLEQYSKTKNALNLSKYEASSNEDNAV
jgi:hypothetical protein